MTHLKSALLVIGSGSSSVTAHSFLVFFDGDDRLNDVVLPQEGAVAGRGVGLVRHRAAGPTARPAQAAALDADRVLQRGEVRRVAVPAGAG